MEKAFAGRNDSAKFESAGMRPTGGNEGYDKVEIGGSSRGSVTSRNPLRTNQRSPTGEGQLDPRTPQRQGRKTYALIADRPPRLCFRRVDMNHPLRARGCRRGLEAQEPKDASPRDGNPLLMRRTLGCRVS
jgi:hypothetical protein